MEDSKQHITTIHELLGMEPGSFTTLAEYHAPAPQDIPAVPPPPVAPPPPPVAPLAPAKSAVRFWHSDYVRLPAIFLVSLLIFYVLLNFRAVTSQVGGWFSPPPKNEVAVLGEVKPDFDRWISKYFVVANDRGMLAANEDADRDGLTNINEFYLETNPLLSDTDSDGYSDGTEVLNGFNPLYSGRLTPEQQTVIEENFDTTQVRQRQEFESSSFIPIVPEAAAVPVKQFVLEPTKAGNLYIPKLGTNVAIVWTQDFARMNDDLKYGVAHHPATVYPGQPGLSSIHGHSSGYPWDGGYKTVFTRLNYLQAGDEVFVTVFALSGDERRFRYIVRSAKVYGKDDPAQFIAPGPGSFLNLSTSWPIGTARDRYVVTAELAGL